MADDERLLAEADVSGMRPESTQPGPATPARDQSHHRLGPPTRSATGNVADMPAAEHRRLVERSTGSGTRSNAPLSDSSATTPSRPCSANSGSATWPLSTSPQSASTSSTSYCALVRCGVRAGWASRWDGSGVRVDGGAGGPDQSELVGEYHRLDAIPQFKLGQDPYDVRLDRAFPDVE